MPVLSGWSLGYKNDDHTLRDFGVSIDSFTFDKNPGDATGTLRYTITMVADNLDGYVPEYRHRVSVLGWNVTGGSNVAPVGEIDPQKAVDE